MGVVCWLWFSILENGVKRLLYHGLQVNRSYTSLDKTGLTNAFMLTPSDSVLVMEFPGYHGHFWPIPLYPIENNRGPGDYSMECERLFL